jgi:hypothetical protein
MDLAEILKEVRATVQIFGLTKWELYGLIGLIAWRLPTILTHVKEIAAIRSEFGVKSKRLSTKLEQAKKKSARKTLKRGEK